MANDTSLISNSGELQYKCIVRQVVYFGLFVDVPELNAKGLVRITELANPAILQDHTIIGTEIFARVLGKETPDGPLILSQR